MGIILNCDFIGFSEAYILNIKIPPTPKMLYKMKYKKYLKNFMVYLLPYQKYLRKIPPINDFIRTMKKLLLTGLSIVTAIAPLSFPLEANAVAFKGDNVYRVSAFETLPGGLVITNTGMGSAPSVSVSILRRRSSARVRGSCGEIRISGSSLGSTPPATIGINDADVDISNLPVINTQCRAGSWSVPPTADTFKTPAGDVINANSDQVGQAAKIDYMARTFQNVTFNACGFGFLRLTDSISLPDNITVNSTNYVRTSLKVAAGAPICTRGATFVPATASWIGP
jgi:hypothetical protein